MIEIMKATSAACAVWLGVLSCSATSSCSKADEKLGLASSDGPESTEGWLQVSEDVREGALAAELEQMNFSAGVAQILREGQTEDAIRMLEERLRDSSGTAELLTRLGTQLQGPSADFLVGVERASRYGAEHEMPEVASRARLISERLR